MADKKDFNPTEYTNKYINKAYDRVNLTLYKGQKSWLIGQIPAAQQSLNAYIQAAIRDKIIADGGDVSGWDALTPNGNTADQGDGGETLQ